MSVFMRYLSKSSVWHRLIRHQGEVNGRWVLEVDADPESGAPAGTLVCDPAPDEPDDVTFTAPNGKRYWDTEYGTRWTPRT